MAWVPGHDHEVRAMSDNDRREIIGGCVMVAVMLTAWALFLRA